MTKVISLSDQAYSVLKNMKKENQSFSDVVLSIAREKNKDILTLAGSWQGNYEELDTIFDSILTERKNTKPRDVKL